jgi:hypothetical protein
MSRKLSGVLIQHKTGTASQWTSINPTLAKGEIGFETDTAKMKIGDGVTTYNNLPYLGESAAANLNLITGNSFSGLVIQGMGDSDISITTMNNPFNGIGGIILSIDATTMGANGIDSGDLLPSTFYYEYICYGSAGICGLISESSSDPQLPEGYNSKAIRIGACLTNIDSKIYRFIQMGDHFQFMLDGTLLSSFSAIFALNSNSVYVAKDISGFFPKTAQSITAYVQYEDTNVGRYILSYTSGNDGAFDKYYTTNGYRDIPCRTIQFLAFSTIYLCGNANGNLRIVGWIDNL